MPDLRTLSGHEFARRIADAVNELDKRYAFFLGAGCSVSSGIPAASALVRDDWIPRLQKFAAPDVSDDRWIATELPEYDGTQPASGYGQVMERLFFHPEERQREIERLCDGRFPGFGYGVLASLMALNSGHFNVALTTNFDDLLADAMYLYTSARPLVSITSRLQPSSARRGVARS